MTHDEARATYKRLVWDRGLEVADDEWSARKPPLTDEQLAQAREAMAVIVGPQYEPGAACDGCVSAQVCPLVFDPYNSDPGDCLWDKQ